MLGREATSLYRPAKARSSRRSNTSRRKVAAQEWVEPFALSVGQQIQIAEQGGLMGVRIESEHAGLTDDTIFDNYNPISPEK